MEERSEIRRYFRDALEMDILKIGTVLKKTPQTLRRWTEYQQMTLFD